MITTLSSPFSTPPRKPHHSATLSAPLSPAGQRQLAHFAQNVLSPAANQRLQQAEAAIAAANQQNAALTTQVTVQAAALQQVQTQMNQMQTAAQQTATQLQTMQQRLTTTSQERDRAVLQVALTQVRINHETAVAEASVQGQVTVVAAHRTEVANHYDTQQALLGKHFGACAKIINEELQRTGWAKVTGFVKDVKDVGGTAAIGFLAAGVPTGNAKAASAGGAVGCMFGMVEKVVGSSWDFQIKTMVIATEIYQASQVCKKNGLYWQPENNLPLAGREVFSWVKTIWMGDTFEAQLIKKALAGKDPTEMEMLRETDETDAASVAAAKKIAAELTASAPKTAAQPSTAAAASANSSWWSTMTSAVGSVLRWQ